MARHRQPWLAALALIAAAASCIRAWADESYPSRPIELVVTAAPGGPPDIVARWLAERLSPILGHPIVVIDKPGAGGNLAMQTVARSAPDGYTLVVAGQGPFALNPHMYANPGYDALRDFAPITQIERGPLILAVHPAVAANTVSELTALARREPGRLSYGTPGNGTPPHMVAELFARMAGIDVLRVPYQGTGAAMIDLIAGRLTYTFGAIPVQLPQVRAGKIRALAMTGAVRSPLAPTIPTMAEAGLPGFEYAGWLGIAAPAATPAAIVTRLRNTIADLLSTPDAQRYFNQQGRETVGSTPADFAAYIREEYAKWGPVIRDANVRAE